MMLSVLFKSGKIETNETAIPLLMDCARISVMLIFPHHQGIGLHLVPRRQ
jgi:hypothetical protein